MKLKDIKLNSLDYQTGNKGKFRQIAINKGSDESWINNVLCYDWFYTFKYENGEFFTLHFDSGGTFVRMINNFFIKKS